MILLIFKLLKLKSRYARLTLSSFKKLIIKKLFIKRLYLSNTTSFIIFLKTSLSDKKVNKILVKLK